ncbi:MAG: hypothetical protein V1777_02990 [Candidatus Micrarchaeota archaeon]
MSQKLTALQEMVLVHLVGGAKTIEELRGVTNANYADLVSCMRSLVIEKVLDKKKGFPTKYRIAEDSLFLAKKLRAKLDMSDLLTDPCSVQGAPLVMTKTAANSRAYSK